MTDKEMNNCVPSNQTMLTLIGLGLGDVRDITLNGLDAIKKADKVFLEAYTSILCSGEQQSEMNELYGKEVIPADRDTVEADINIILNEASKCNVAFLVVGDVFGATTHTDLVLRAKEQNIPVRVIHNASIITAVGCCGLQLYNFGEIVSIPLWTETWRPISFMNKINSNLKRKLHTLCLLDIKVKEKSIEAMMKGRDEYEPPRFMSVAVAAQQILAAVEESQKQAEKEEEKGEEDDDSNESSEQILTPASKCVGLARVGATDQQILYADLQTMSYADLGRPLHCLIIPGHLHPLEITMLESFMKVTN